MKCPYTPTTAGPPIGAAGEDRGAVSADATAAGRGGCPEHIEIGDILKSPRAYESREIVVEGKAVNDF